MTTAPALPASLHDISDGYDAVLCDVWGVIHDGVRSFPAACAALERFGRERGPVVLISNSPRPSPDVVPQLRALGVPEAAWAGFVTSGDATRAELAARAPGPVWAIGPERDGVLYAGLDLHFARGPDDAAFICCTGPVDDTRETPDDYRDALGRAAARDLLMVCANPDRVVQRGEQLIFCGGALADLYETLGGRVLMAGKPYAPIYTLALAEVGRRLGRTLDRARVLCIGDGLRTDVAGANREDLDLLFIAAGIHAADALGPEGALDPARTADLLADEGLAARYALPRLV